jgi:serine/threonine protein kinase
MAATPGSVLRSRRIEARSALGVSRENCDGDDELRKELEGLLEATNKPLDFLRQPVLEAAKRIVSDQHGPAIASGTHLAHYEIISILGAGGMGEVYLANDLRLKRKVALKMLKPELTQEERTLRRFEQEAQAASALNHPNILTVYEFGQAEGLRFIASEFIEGQVLRQMMVAKGRLHPEMTVEVAIQISSALSAAHACGIVHRDIKPDNVIVRTDGIAKVLDFGIAKLNERREETLRRRALELAAATSVPGMVMGTAKYMSPEQARGLVVDARSDIFSLGSVMYEMITGRAAFDGETASVVMAAILTTDPPPPANCAPDVPYELERIISKALRKDRETRYQSAKDMIGDLKEFKKESEFRAAPGFGFPPTAQNRMGQFDSRAGGPGTARVSSEFHGQKVVRARVGCRACPRRNWIFLDKEAQRPSGVSPPAYPGDTPFP